MQGFIQFIREQGVVGLAVGFILGGAVSGLVSSLVEDVINPVIGLIVGNADLSSYSAQVGEASINYGALLTTVIDFIIIAAVVYFIFKGLKLDKLDAKKDK